MGKRRTRKQKIKAKVEAEKRVVVVEETETDQGRELVIKDLVKTLWVAGVIGVVLGLAIYWLR